MDNALATAVLLAVISVVAGKTKSGGEGNTDIDRVRTFSGLATPPRRALRDTGIGAHLPSCMKNATSRIALRIVTAWNSKQS